MWVAFFVILFLLRDFFALMFLTFIFAFVMYRVAKFAVRTTRAPWWATVLFPYLIVLSLLVLLMVFAIPKVYEEGLQFSQKVPEHLRVLAGEIHKTAARHRLENALAKYLHIEQPPVPLGPTTATTPAPEIPFATVPDPSTLDAIIVKLEDIVFGFLPGAAGQDRRQYLPEMLRKFVAGVAEGTLTFLLAVILSFLIVLDFDHVKRELTAWQQSPIGHFFHEAAASVVRFADMVGTAFQCQLAVSCLNSLITCIGLMILDIQPVLLLTTIVFLLGLIPVLGVWISSVPIVLIAFNDHGWERAALAVGLITLVHLLEAYVFNPRIYAARFHLNPVIVLIILLVGHKAFGIWGMLLGIPVTYYVLNIAQVPALPRKQKHKKGNPATVEA
jgi:predicted PurR-regulated permease PerM